MRYYKILQDGYILSIGKGTGGEDLTESEYTQILDSIRNKPTAPDRYEYRLKSDLTWERLELPVAPEDADPDLTDSEALGSPHDPIPYEGNMALVIEKYYSQDGVTYLCNRDTINPVYNPLRELVGIYVEIVN